MCDVLAVEEILGHFLQTVAGQIHQTDSLRHHLQNTHLINIRLFTQVKVTHDAKLNHGKISVLHGLGLNALLLELNDGPMVQDNQCYANMYLFSYSISSINRFLTVISCQVLQG